MTSLQFTKVLIVIVTIAIVVMPTSAMKVQFVSLSSSSKLRNCTWLDPSDEGLQLMNASPSVWRSTAARLESANIYCIIVWTGQWDQDHTINYADSPTVWTQFINTVKAVNPNFVVLALVNGWGIDISDPAYRETMLNAVEQLMSSAPFDGVNDDLEDFKGTNQNLIDFWQAEASLVKGLGKIATVDLGVDWPYTIEEVYPYLTNFDYLMPMFYGKIQDTYALSYWDRILSNSPVPIIMGLDVDPSDMNNFSMSQQLSWIDQALNNTSHPNLAGFAIWSYDFWGTSEETSNDFAAWSNWSTKGFSPSPTLKPLEVAVVALVAVTIVAVAIALLYKKKTRTTAAMKK